MTYTIYNGYLTKSNSYTAVDMTLVFRNKLMQYNVENPRVIPATDTAEQL